MGKTNSWPRVAWVARFCMSDHVVDPLLCINVWCKNVCPPSLLCVRNVCILRDKDTSLTHRQTPHKALYIHSRISGPYRSTSQKNLLRSHSSLHQHHHSHYRIQQKIFLPSLWKFFFPPPPPPLMSFFVRVSSFVFKVGYKFNWQNFWQNFWHFDSPDIKM